MSKNIVVITSMPGEVDTSYQEYCLNTWRWWCKKNDVELLILDEPLTDTSFMKPTWQRWYVFDILDSNNFDYEKVALVDVDTMIKWDTPNFFNMTKDKFCGVKDQDNIGWIKQSIDGYKQFFKETDLHWLDYFNCGFIVMSKKHKEICKSIVNFWDENTEKLTHLQNTISKGTDQTPVNYILKGSKFEVNYLPKTFNLTHFNRKEILQDLVFIDCGYIWHFNGFDKSWRTPLMRDTWNKIKDNYED
tara:strand:- start:1593 stop:2330 length:738 start_codon:yes stop_codon:yes gene_type:complete